MITIYLTKSEYDKIPESKRSIYHPHPSNHQGKNFEGLPSITLNATHREYVIGREIEIVDKIDGIPKNKIGTIINCKSCKELSIADQKNPTMCPYCASLYRTTKKMPEKADMPEALQKAAAITELSTLALQKEYKRVLKSNSGKKQFVDVMAKKHFVYRFYAMIAKHSWLLRNFMEGHSANFSDDQRKAACLAASELNKKLESEPQKYAKPYSYFKKYVLDGMPISKIALQDDDCDSQDVKSAMGEYLSDLLADDWQLRFIIGYGAANQAIRKEFPKHNKEHVTETDVATKLIAKILAAGDLYKYVVPNENEQIETEPTVSAITAETEMVCKKLLYSFYKDTFIVHPYIEDPIHARTEMAPCWQQAKKHRGKNVYNISIPYPARENLYTLSMYLLSCFLSIYCKKHDIPDSSEETITFAEKHGLKAKMDENGSISIYGVNDKTLEVLESQSWPKWLYFCIRDRREKKAIDEEKKVTEEILCHLSLAESTTSDKDTESNDNMFSDNEDEASRLYGQQMEPYTCPINVPIPPKMWEW